MLNREKLEEEFRFYKNCAQISFENHKIGESLSFIRYCGLIAWYYPILYSFSDDELEELLDKITDAIIVADIKNETSAPVLNRVVLYAGQIIDNGALTEQYLNFLIAKKYKILVIVPSKKNISLGKRTLERLNNYSDIEIFIPSNEDLKFAIKAIYRKVIDFNPSCAFLHFLPNDVVGYCSFFKITHIPRYYIVHNDHTFWLGKGCSDYFIEFRKLGYLIATQRRKIPYEKIYILPFYPINDKIDFKGFPFERQGKIVGVSGANLYKYLLDPELKFFHAIKYLLKRNGNFIFCLCGNGDGIEQIKSVFNDEDVKGRFFYLGKRGDFYNLIGNSDILFDSYPFKGGLTILYGVEQGKPLVGIANPRNASGAVDEFLGLTGYKEPVEVTDFIKEADLLIKDSGFRGKKAALFTKNRFNRSHFEEGLSSILSSSFKINQPLYDGRLELDDDYYLNEYLILPNSSTSLLRGKIFSLNGAINLKERFVNTLKLMRDAQYSLNIKEVLRLSFLLVFGR